VTPSTTATTAVGVRRVALRLPAVPWDAVTAWALAFALVLYLALRGGGFDAVVRDQVGILVWWAVLLVAVAGLLPRLTRAGWIVLGLLAAWAAWTALGIGSSESAERTLAEVGRLCAYTGVLALALTLQARAGSRHVLNAVATAIGVVTVLAVLSRLHPQWFPGNDHMRFLPDEARRLSYPLNYWNALAGFLAMGAVLLLAVAATARTRLGQFLAAATVPLAGLGCYLAISRGGAIVFVVGLINYMLLTVDRLARLGTLAVTGGAAALLIVAADQRPAIQTGLDTAAAREQGAELLWLCVIVCIGAGLVHVAIELLARHADRPPWMRVDRRRATASLLAGLGSVVVVFFASGLNHELADRWAEFKQPPEVTGRLSTDSVFARFDSGAGQGRWQYWQVALDAFQENPARGIGGGAFELYWARNATVEGSITDAHSLYAQTLAEVGWVGFALLLGLVVLTVAGGAVRALPAHRPAAPEQHAQTRLLRVPRHGLEPEVRVRKLIIVLLAAVAAQAAGCGGNGTETAPDARFPEDFVGIVTEDAFAQVGGPGYRSAQLAAQRRAGIGLVRQTFSWKTIEPRRGRYELAYHDRFVLDAARAGLTVMPILFDTPGFYARPVPRAAGHAAAVPRDLRAMARFAVALERRYGRRGTLWAEHPDVPPRPITAWQIWNEPNLPAYWAGEPNAAEYVEMLRTVGSALRGVDPDAEIVTAGLPESRLGVSFATYLKEMYAAGAAGTFDTLAINAYSERVQGIVAAALEARRIMAAAEDGDQALRITEFGWATPARGARSRFTVGPRTQAVRLATAVRALARQRERLRLRSIVYYAWRDARPWPGGQDFWGLHTGLLDMQGRPKPALAALSRTVERLRKDDADHR
jgi:hypothetical protein